MNDWEIRYAMRRGPRTPFVVDGEQGAYTVVVNDLAQYPQVVWLSHESIKGWRCMRCFVTDPDTGRAGLSLRFHRRTESILWIDGKVKREEVAQEFLALAELLLE